MPRDERDRETTCREITGRKLHQHKTESFSAKVLLTQKGAEKRDVRGVADLGIDSTKCRERVTPGRAQVCPTRNRIARIATRNTWRTSIVVPSVIADNLRGSELQSGRAPHDMLHAFHRVNVPMEHCKQLCSWCSTAHSHS